MKMGTNKLFKHLLALCLTLSACAAPAAVQVTEEAAPLAAAAAEYLQKGSLPPCPLEVKAGANVGHVIPQHVSGTRSFTLSLRVRQPLKKVTLTVTQNGREVLRRKFPKALPAEMIQLTVPAEKLETAGDLEVSVQ